MSMTFRRKLPGGLAAAAIGAALILQPTAANAAPLEPGSIRATDLAQAAFAGTTDLSRTEGVTVSRTAVFHATAGTDAAAIGALPPDVIICLLVTRNPHLTTSGEVQASSQVTCNWLMPLIVLEVGLYRDGNLVDTSTDDGVVAFTVDATNSVPCTTGDYVEVGVAGIQAPAGYQPSVLWLGAASEVVSLTCAGSEPPPPPSPPDDPRDPPLCPRCEIP